MPNPTPSAPARIDLPPGRPDETPAEKFRRIVAGIAATLDETFPSVVIGGGLASIDDDSAFYGSDDGRPGFVAADDAAFRTQ